jgi:hypothetical protein
MMIAPMTARGRFFCGSLISPANWSACSKPSRANTTPAVGSALNTDWMPNGMNPPPAPKLLAWNLVNNTMMASTGIATFHQVMPELTLENSRMARKFDRGEDGQQDDRQHETQAGRDLRRRVVDIDMVGVEPELPIRGTR